MLVSLHVKNFAIIDEVWVDFGPGLNVLTGETGAGKSILLGALNMALGAKTGKEVLGKNGEYALAELVFEGEQERVGRILEQYDLPREDTIVISRKVSESGRSTARVNGEAVSQNVLKELAAVLLDIHGQHEHQSLLRAESQLQLLDRYALFGTEHGSLKRQMREQFHAYEAARKSFEEAQGHKESYVREQDLLAYEVKEIEEAALKKGEDALLEERYQELLHANRCEEAVSGALSLLEDGRDSSLERLGRALRGTSKVSGVSKELAEIHEELSLLEEQMSAVTARMGQYLESLAGSEEEFRETEERLNRINRLKAKYGASIQDILNYGSKAAKKLEQYSDFEGYLEQLQAAMEQSRRSMELTAKQLSKLRAEGAGALGSLVRQALEELNFLEVRFEVAVTEREQLAATGGDEVSFLIGTNPGEPLRPLAKIASGGELSRIMLALKSVFAGTDEIDTLVFDEIDVGVSGRTAQKVAEKMAAIGRHHQVICITHLPQIAAMGDLHFYIEKRASEGSTVTTIARLSEEERVRELARILGGAKITESAMEHAREMRQLAQESKQGN